MMLPLLLVLFLAIAPPARAELPPYKPEMLLPDPNTPKAQKLPPIYRGPFEFYTTQFSEGDSLKIIEGTQFGFHLEDIILPISNGKEGEISTPYYEPLGMFTENTQWLQMPQEVLSKSIYYDENENENLRETGFCARIFNRSKYSDAQEDISSSGTQVSSNMEGTQKWYDMSRRLNSVLGLHEFESATPGYYDSNLPLEKQAVKDFSGYCMRKLPSTEYIELDNSVTQLATWGSESIPVMGYVYETLTKIISWFNPNTGQQEEKEVPETFVPQYRVDLTGADLPSNNAQNCNVGDCVHEEIDGTKYEWVKKLATTRGFTFNFLPEHRSEDPEQKDPANRAALSEFDYAVFGKTDGNNGAGGKLLFGDDQGKNYKQPTSALKNAQYRLQQMACTSVPDELLKKFTITLADPDKLTLGQTAAAGAGSAGILAAKALAAAIPINDLCGPPEEEEIAQCPIHQIAKMSGGSASCKLTDVTKENLYKIVSDAGFNPKTALPYGLPPLAQKVLDAAADQYGVPASVLLGTMIDEGAFMYPEWVWADDEAIKTFSDCTNPEPMLKCEDHANSTSQGAQGPFGILQSEWEKDAVKNTIFEAFPDRPKENVTSCNFVDAAYTAAKVLSKSAHYFVDDPVPNEPPPTTPPLPESCNGQTVSHERDPLTQCSQWDASRVALARMQYAERACTPSVDILVNTYKTYTSGAH